MSKLTLKYALLSALAIAPSYASSGAAGFDLHLPEAISLYKDSSVTVNLGIALEVPEGHVAIILPRSGAGFKYGVELANTAAVIDADYRGEIVLRLTLKEGVGDAFVHLEAGAAVVQAIILPVPAVELVKVHFSELSQTDRGAAGLGSTGTSAHQPVGSQQQAAPTDHTLAQRPEVISEVQVSQEYDPTVPDALRNLQAGNQPLAGLGTQSPAPVADPVEPVAPAQEPVAPATDTVVEPSPEAPVDTGTETPVDTQLAGSGERGENGNGQNNEMDVIDNSGGTVSPENVATASPTTPESATQEPAPVVDGEAAQPAAVADAGGDTNKPARSRRTPS